MSNNIGSYITHVLRNGKKLCFTYMVQESKIILTDYHTVEFHHVFSNTMYIEEEKSHAVRLRLHARK